MEISNLEISNRGSITAPIWTRLTPEDHAALTALANESEVTISQITRYALRKFIFEHKKKDSQQAEQG